MKDFLIFWGLFLAILCVFFYLYWLSGNNYERMLTWAKRLYSIAILPIITFMWIYESLQKGKWFDVRGNEPLLGLLIDLFIFAALFLIEWQYKRNKERFDPDNGFTGNYLSQRLGLSLFVSILGVPIINAAFLWYFIKEFFF